RHTARQPVAERLADHAFLDDRPLSSVLPAAYRLFPEVAVKAVVAFALGPPRYGDRQRTAFLAPLRDAENGLHGERRRLLRARDARARGDPRSEPSGREAGNAPHIIAEASRASCETVSRLRKQSVTAGTRLDSPVGPRPREVPLLPTRRRHVRHGNADRLDLANLAAPGLEDVDRRQVERLNVERPAPLSRHTESDRLRRECECNGKDRSGFDRSSHRCLRCNVLAPPVERQDLLLVPRVEPARNGASGAASW